MAPVGQYVWVLTLNFIKDLKNYGSGEHFYMSNADGFYAYVDDDDGETLHITAATPELGYNSRMELSWDTIIRVSWVTFDGIYQDEAGRAAAHYVSLQDEYGKGLDPDTAAAMVAQHFGYDFKGWLKGHHKFIKEGWSEGHHFEWEKEPDESIASPVSNADGMVWLVGIGLVVLIFSMK